MIVDCELTENVIQTRTNQCRDAAVRTHSETNGMLNGQPGWSRDQTFETRMRLRAFDEDWNAPGMEKYDEL